ncbi:MAG: S8/S53 family peptidase [Holophagaceae bacterium]|nr:S8/S53 family peptidase [Holophagaceae bacterium]
MPLLFPVIALVLQTAPSPQTQLAAALKIGSLAWQLSGPEEVTALLGTPQQEEKLQDGGREFLIYRYDTGLMVMFDREPGLAPFGLWGYQKGGDRVLPKPDEPLALRNKADLGCLRSFSGLQNVDVSRVDLKAEGARLHTLPFDTLTRWPTIDKLPVGFDPNAILAVGRNPGLGLRTLHARGKDGRGVDIAIIDQPLVADHVETEGRLHLVAELDVKGVPPQMHGPGVSSLAVGRTCGTAPGANLYYVSMPMGKPETGNRYYLQALERLLELNRGKTARIRAVSISYGEFTSAPQADLWKTLLEQAEREGVLVITCDEVASRLSYGLLRPLPGGDREKPEGYTLGAIKGEILVPGDGRTYASHRGRGVYSYSPQSGLSWAAPWLVGLAALGFQANPKLTPARVRTYLMKSATKTPFGRVANPAAFLELCVADPDIHTK